MKKLLLTKITLICSIFISTAACGKKTTKPSTQKSESKIVQTKASLEQDVSKSSSYDWIKNSNMFGTNETEKANSKIIALKTAIDVAIKATNKPPYYQESG